MSPYSERTTFREEAGLLFESLGMTRMAGRIMGHLMTTDKEMVSFDEFAQILQASKSAISTNLQALVQIQFIKAASLPGDRKTYYLLSPDQCWHDMHKKRLEVLNYMAKMFGKGLTLRLNKNDGPSKWLKESIDFYTNIIHDYMEVLEKYKK